MGAPLSSSDLVGLLTQTSRTFALAIPLLEEPLATYVGVAYLLFRIADTLEDAPRWGRETRGRALASFARWLEESSDERDETWAGLVREEPPTIDEGCMELLARADEVRASAGAMPAPVEAAILASARRTALGMRDFVERQDERGGLTLLDLDDLRRYAYVVAGIVGELLTALFALSSPNLANVEATLSVDASLFGEGLQLVNILKDAPADRCEGRSYIPDAVPVAEVVTIARDDLRRAERYVATLRGAGAPRGVVAFCELPARLAVATLDALESGAPKLGREEVLRIFADVARG
jgi:farnesyl-diphosphate farnesyltransferase